MWVDNAVTPVKGIDFKEIEVIDMSARRNNSLQCSNMRTDRKRYGNRNSKSQSPVWNATVLNWNPSWVPKQPVKANNFKMGGEGGQVDRYVGISSRDEMASQ